MERVREIFAKNLRQYRQKCGFSQAKFAEKVGVSTHHIAMIELTRNFPTSDLMERFTEALNIEIYKLFVEPNSSSKELQQLRQDIKSDFKQTLDEYFGYQEEKPKKIQ